MEIRKIVALFGAIVIAAVLGGCSEESKQSMTDTAEKAGDKVQDMAKDAGEATSDAWEATKDAASDAADAAGEMADDATAESAVGVETGGLEGSDRL